jgi:hypothetical protein
MEITYEEVKKKTLAQLREMAASMDHPALQGYTQLHKAELIPKVCEALGIEAHVHHEVVGVNKADIKKKIRKAKTERDKALASKNQKKLRESRAQIHELKRQLRKALT